MFNLILSNWRIAIYAVVAIAFGALYWRVSYLKNENKALVATNQAYKQAQAETLATIEKLKQQQAVDMWAVRETIKRDKEAMQSLQGKIDAIRKEQDAPCAAVLVKTVELLGKK